MDETNGRIAETGPIHIINLESDVEKHGPRRCFAHSAAILDELWIVMSSAAAKPSEATVSRSTTFADAPTVHELHCSAVDISSAHVRFDHAGIGM